MSQVSHASRMCTTRPSSLRHRPRRPEPQTAARLQGINIFVWPSHPHLFGRPSIRISHTTLTFMCSGFHVAGGVWTMATLGGWCALVAPSAASSRSLRDSCLLMVAFPLEWLRPTPCVGPISHYSFSSWKDLLLGVRTATNYYESTTVCGSDKEGVEPARTARDRVLRLVGPFRSIACRGARRHTRV